MAGKMHRFPTGKVQIREIVLKVRYIVNDGK